MKDKQQISMDDRLTCLARRQNLNTRQGRAIFYTIEMLRSEIIEESLSRNETINAVNKIAGDLMIVSMDELLKDAEDALKIDIDDIGFNLDDIDFSF